MMLRALPLVLLGSALLACGDDSNPGAGGSGGVSAGGSEVGGAGGQPMTIDPTVESVHAPDEHTVVVTLAGDVEVVPEPPTAYKLTSDFGDLEVSMVAYDAAAKTITLTTPKQKLGVTYYLAVKAPGNPLDLQTKTFLSADTAVFWVTDFSDFSELQVTASRLDLGENIVLYATDGASGATGVADAISAFDEQILPAETALFDAFPDRDGNGKLVVLGLDGAHFYSGYFNPANSLTEAEAQQLGLHSNEMEMLYVSVPDTAGTFGADQTLPHEFSHLLYNESHDFFQGDWSWHNEGMAECAVHAVYGGNPSLFYYLQDPDLANGQSLVIWTYANYAQYIQSYVFLTYVASRLGGVSGYGQLFDLSGDPADVDAFFQTEFGQGFAATQLDMLTAAFLQEPTGVHGFSGMLTLGGQPQLATAPPTQLLPFTAVFLGAAGNGLTPQGQGADVVHRGVSFGNPADASAPFDVSGGAVIALNTVQDALSTATESSGTLAMSLVGPAANQPSANRLSANAELWKHPPPIKPANMEQLRAWRRAAHGF